MTKPLIGLTQRVDVVPHYAEQRDALDQAWTGWVEEMGFCPLPIPNRLQNIDAFLQALPFVGFILTGGNDIHGTPGAENVAPERDALEREIIEYTKKHGLPLVGICRGAQMLGIQLGARLQAIDNHVCPLHGINVLDAFSSAYQVAEVNSYHRYGFYQDDLPDCLTVTSMGDDGVVESFEHKSLPLVGLQWHPERAPYQESVQHYIQSVFTRRL